MKEKLFRNFCSAAVAIGMALSLFWVMQNMIKTPQGFKPSKPLPAISFVETEIKTEPIKQPPNKPPEPEEILDQPAIELPAFNPSPARRPAPLIQQGFSAPELVSNKSVFHPDMPQGPGGMVDSGGLITLSQIQPLYPHTANVRGIEGFVLLGFTVSPDGRVSDIQVLESNPAGIFERAAKKALYKWRFKAGGQSHRRKQLFEFKFE